MLNDAGFQRFRRNRMILTLAILVAHVAAAPAGTKPNPLTPETLHKAASQFYLWRQQNYPVGASEQGNHTWDERLTDYSPAAISNRQQFVKKLLARVRATDISGWSKDDKID